MTAFRKIVALLVAVALLAGAPAAAFGGAAASPDCPTLSTAPGDDGCCGGNGSMPGCHLVCAMSVAAVAGKDENVAVPVVGSAPLERHPSQTGLIARPPDTAPPKSLSA